ncbi:MAG TPA: PaaI family thioesterase, partial [Rhizomicrobium sp.]
MPLSPGLPEDAEDISLRGFNKSVGPLYSLPDDGGPPRLGFVVAEKHMNAAGTVHGGMLMALADVSMGRTSRLIAEAEIGSTVALSCDFLAPGRLGDLIE